MFVLLTFNAAARGPQYSLPIKNTCPFTSGGCHTDFASLNFAFIAAQVHPVGRHGQFTLLMIFSNRFQRCECDSLVHLSSKHLSCSFLTVRSLARLPRAMGALRRAVE